MCVCVGVCVRRVLILTIFKIHIQEAEVLS